MHPDDGVDERAGPGDVPVKVQLASGRKHGGLGQGQSAVAGVDALGKPAGTGMSIASWPGGASQECSTAGPFRLLMQVRSHGADEIPDIAFPLGRRNFLNTSRAFVCPHPLMLFGNPLHKVGHPIL